MSTAFGRSRGNYSVYHTVAELLDTRVVAKYGLVIGRVLDAYLDEQSWQIQYLLIEAAGQGERALLFASEAVRSIDMDQGRILVEGQGRFDVASVRELNALRSARDIIDCSVAGWTGSIGRTEDVLFEADSWIVRFLMIDASSWCPGGTLFVRPDLIQEAQWGDKSLCLAVTHVEVLEVAGVDEEDVDMWPRPRVFH
jgi:sporulation protein YlmC with PRC-barrel domain